MKALIVDDESKARNLLKNILLEYCPQVTEIFEASDLPEGVKVIHTNKPQVVFLDVEMPTYLGTQIMEFFDATKIDFEIIFTTAYSEYALKAFELNAVSYLLKPLRPNQIIDALKKVEQTSNTKKINESLTELNSFIKTNQITKIGVPVSDGVLFIKIEDIFYFKADGMYTEIYIKNENKLVVSKPLKYFVNLLEEIENIRRVHRSFLVNINYIKKIVRKTSPYLVMDNNDVVNLSKENLENLLSYNKL